MHELIAVTKGLLKICLEEGEKHKIKKNKKNKYKGWGTYRLTSACIEYYFNIVSKDTIAENTKINVEKIPVEIKCNECGYSGVLGKNNYVCLNARE